MEDWEAEMDHHDDWDPYSIIPEGSPNPECPVDTDAIWYDGKCRESDDYITISRDGIQITDEWYAYEVRDHCLSLCADYAEFYPEYTGCEADVAEKRCRMYKDFEFDLDTSEMPDNFCAEVPRGYQLEHVEWRSGWAVKAKNGKAIMDEDLVFLSDTTDED